MENQIFRPRKRQDLEELSNKVFALTSAIGMKIELESQIASQTKLISVMKLPSLWGFVAMVFAFKIWLQRKLKKKIEISRLASDLGVKEKQKNIYHRNELLLEQDFEDVYKELEERFTYYLKMLQKIASEDYTELNHNTNLDKLPLKDVEILSVKYNTDPPKTKTDRISYYLAMENLLYRCQNS